MKRAALSFISVLFCFMLIPVAAFGAFTFSDDRFQGVFTTDNLDMIIEEYHLYDGWYWTTMADIPQSFTGNEDRPGWTDGAVNTWNKKEYLKGWYGYRWGIDKVSSYHPDRGGYGECFGFAQFIGYLLSGEVNPQGRWKFYYSVEKAGGLRIGDIIRVEYKRNKRTYQHSAVVYSVDDESITFLQVSSSAYNRISVGTGFSDGYYKNITTIEEISHLPYLRISRSQLNTDK